MSHTPVSALTANVIKGARERGLLSGFDSFLGKPIVLKELERVFMSYLKLDTLQVIETDVQSSSTATIIGLDAQMLRDELMLTHDELIMLLGLFIKKMTKVIPELQNAIKKRDFKKIALNAHSIKGSSGNFRIESLQNSSSEMEKMAKSENSEYDYEGTFKDMQEIISKIKIS